MGLLIYNQTAAVVLVPPVEAETGSDEADGDGEESIGSEGELAGVG